MDNDPPLNYVTGEWNGREVAWCPLEHQNLIALALGDLLDADENTAKVVSAEHHHHDSDGWRWIHRSLLPRARDTALIARDKILIPCCVMMRNHRPMLCWMIGTP
jgi:hypothetical protein